MKPDRPRIPEPDISASTDQPQTEPHWIHFQPNSEANPGLLWKAGEDWFCRVFGDVESHRTRIPGTWPLT
jgi:hypothetical protein